MLESSLLLLFFITGVGDNVNSNELNSVATSANGNYVFTVSLFSSLATKLVEFASTMCLIGTCSWYFSCCKIPVIQTTLCNTFIMRKEPNTELLMFLYYRKNVTETVLNFSELLYQSVHCVRMKQCVAVSLKKLTLKYFFDTLPDTTKAMSLLCCGTILYVELFMIEWYWLTFFSK